MVPNVEAEIRHCYDAMMSSGFSSPREVYKQRLHAPFLQYIHAVNIVQIYTHRLHIT